jgi:hypothetical protein
MLSTQTGQFSTPMLYDFHMEDNEIQTASADQKGTVRKPPPWKTSAQVLVVSSDNPP